MACYHPVTGYRSKELNSNGKRSLVFSVRQALDPDNPIKIACGRCIGCRLERSRQWAIRCVHENQLYSGQSEFITLTYSDENLPLGKTLVKSDLQKFMKRLRKAVGSKVRFFGCGEYGELFERPHYHLCLFGYRFPDRKAFKSIEGTTYYTSDLLQKIWKYGHTLLGDVTFESAAYVARYITKKITGEKADKYYLDQSTGLLREPEFPAMSRRPGIGRDWLEKYWSDVFPWDSVVIRGKEVKPPKYYINRLEVVDPYGFDDLKEHRKLDAIMLQSDNTYERLRVKEGLQEQFIKEKKRRFER